MIQNMSNNKLTKKCFEKFETAHVAVTLTVNVKVTVTITVTVTVR